jgi:hypothetical protein
LNKFTIVPNKCKVTYVCDSVSPTTAGAPICDNFVYDFEYNGQATDGKLTFVATPEDYKNNVYVPGTYVVTVKGTPAKQPGREPEYATFNIVLLDPCDPPQSLTPPEHVDMSYTLTDGAE